MNIRLMRLIILPLGLISVLLLEMLPFSFARVTAQANNNTSIQRRLSKYSPVKAPYLTPASRGQPVRDVQAVLQYLGFYNGAIDGIYGPRTTRAVVAFQRSHRIVGDGRVGALTWQALRSNIAPVRRRRF